MPSSSGASFPSVSAHRSAPDAVDDSGVTPAFNEADDLPATPDALALATVPTGPAGRGGGGGQPVRGRHRGRGARVVREPVRQIARARNAGAAAARGRYLVFVDADTVVPPALLARAIDAMVRGRAGGGGATLLPDRRLGPAAARALAFWNRMSTAFGIAAGSFLFCTREGFRAAGGFDDRLFVAEEFFFSLRCRQWCRRRGLSFTVFRSPSALSSARKLDWYSPGQVLLMACAMAAFPVVMRFKPLGRHWYSRPDASG